MSALSIQPAFPNFAGTDGLPLENGYIWIGAANLDPQANPVNVYWDEALTISAPQPIRTINGYASRSGTPANIYVNSDYSIRVQDSKGSAVYSNLFVPGLDGSVTTDMLADGAVTTPKIADGSITTPKIVNSAVTYAKIQNVAAAKVLGRDTSGAGVVQELPIAVDTGGNVSIAGNISMTGTTSRFNQVNDLDVIVTEIGIGVLSGLDDSLGFNNQTVTGSLYFGTASVTKLQIDNTGLRKSVIPGGTVLYSEYQCRAWVNFNGTGTVAIRASGNVSSITDNGTGDYTVNFSTAMPDANYGTSIVAQAVSGNSRLGHTSDVVAPTSSTYRLVITQSGGSVADSAIIAVAVFR